MTTSPANFRWIKSWKVSIKQRWMFGADCFEAKHKGFLVVWACWLVDLFLEYYNIWAKDLFERLKICWCKPLQFHPDENFQKLSNLQETWKRLRPRIDNWGSPMKTKKCKTCRKKHGQPIGLKTHGSPKTITPKVEGLGWPHHWTH